jgi:hypothetical protein
MGTTTATAILPCWLRPADEAESLEMIFPLEFVEETPPAPAEVPWLFEAVEVTVKITVLPSLPTLALVNSVTDWEVEAGGVVVVVGCIVVDEVSGVVADVGGVVVELCCGVLVDDTITVVELAWLVVELCCVVRLELVGAAADVVLSEAVVGCAAELVVSATTELVPTEAVDVFVSVLVSILEFNVVVGVVSGLDVVGSALPVPVLVEAIADILNCLTTTFTLDR